MPGNLILNDPWMLDKTGFHRIQSLDEYSVERQMDRQTDSNKHIQTQTQTHTYK